MKIVVEESNIAIMLSPDNASKQTKKRQISTFQKEADLLPELCEYRKLSFPQSPLYHCCLYVQSDSSFGYYKSGTKLIILGRIQISSSPSPVRGDAKKVLMRRTVPLKLRNYEEGLQ